MPETNEQPMEKRPMVSVLMTTYNREKYLSFAAESVLNSTWKDLELIIVDDGSKDRTVSIARDYERKDPRVRVFINEKNLGDYLNRNRAAFHARGKYLKYVDSDDYIYPWALEIMVKCMEDHPEAGWGLCSMEPNAKRPFPFMLSPKEAYEYHYLGPGLFRRAPLSSIIRKDVFDSVDGFRPIRMAGDYEMWHRLSQSFPVVLMPAGMVWYRVHESQEINDYRQYINKYEEIKVHYLDSPQCPLDKETAKSIRNRERASIRNYIVRNLLKLNFSMLAINLRNLRYYR